MQNESYCAYTDKTLGVQQMQHIIISSPSPLKDNHFWSQV